MVDERVIAIVRLLGLERLHMVPSIKLDHALITAFVKRWRPETHSFHLPHGEMTITLQDVEVIMGMPIEGEAMVGCTKRTWKTMCNEMLGIQILDENKTMLDGQRIQIKALIDRIAQPLPPDANELQVHQYARCYVLALLGDMVFASPEIGSTSCGWNSWRTFIIHLSIVGVVQPYHGCTDNCVRQVKRLQNKLVEH